MRENGMRIPSWIYAALVCLTLSGSGCFVAMWDYPSTYPSVERFQRSVAFSPGGTVSLRSFDGIVEITGWDRERFEVYAEKLIPVSGQAWAEFWSGDYRRRAPRIEFDSGGDFVSLNTRSPDREGDQCIVDYFLSVPRAVRLRDIVVREGDVFIQDCYGEAMIDLDSGAIVVENFSGSLNAAVRKGRIEAYLYDLRSDDVIQLISRDGDVTLYLEPDVNAEFSGNAPQGAIVTDFDLDTEMKDGRLSGRIGESGARIDLTALRGDIRIRRIEDTEEKP
jgi:hypothetical protein